MPVGVITGPSRTVSVKEASLTTSHGPAAVRPAFAQTVGVAVAWTTICPDDEPAFNPKVLEQLPGPVKSQNTFSNSGDAPVVGGTLKVTRPAPPESVAVTVTVKDDPGAAVTVCGATA